MRVVLILIICLVGLSGTSCKTKATVQSQAKKFSKQNPGAYRPGELLVKFKKGVAQSRIQEINAQQGTEVIKYFEQLEVYHLKITGKNSVEEMVQRYSQLPEVEYAEPNYIQKTFP